MTIYSGELNVGEQKVEENAASFGQVVKTRAEQAIFEGPTAKLFGSAEIIDAERRQEFEFDPVGGLRFDMPKPRSDEPETTLPIDQVRKTVKDAGLERQLPNLGEEPIKPQVLDIMMERARDRKRRQEVIDNGPYGFVPNALIEGTTFLVSAFDPLNLATAFIPVIGELRYAKMLASAGESVLARTAKAALVKGVPAGAIGAAALQPLEAFATRQEGQDFTMAQALHNTMMGAAFGVTLVGGGRFVGDIVQRRRGMPAFPYGPGQPLESHTLYSDVPGVPRTADIPVAETRPFGYSSAYLNRRGAETAEQYIARVGEIHRPLEPGERPALGEFPGAETPRRAATDRLDDETPYDSVVRETAEPPDPVRAIGDDVAVQLRAAGMPADEAAVNATLVAARYRARAEVLGLDSPLELYRREGLDIRGAADLHDEPDGRMYAQRRRQEQDDLFAAREQDGQAQLPGTERITDAELAQRRADQPLKPKADQKPADQGLFSDQAKQRTFFQNGTTKPSWYFSAVEASIDGIKQERMSAEQWLNTIRNRPGVKAEELEWLGLADWLKEHRGPVTKQQIGDYVRANRIQVKEVERRAGGADTEVQFFHGLDDTEWNKLSDRERAALRSEFLADASYEIPGDTNFHTYTLPGGENYREMLLTLPRVDRDTTRPDALAVAKYRAEWDRIKAELEPLNLRFERGDSTVLPEINRLHELLGPIHTAMMDDTMSRVPAHQRADFRTSHWDEPNVLAHIRFNDRIIDGKRALFVEEFQSDWHQAGRRKGYVDRYKPSELSQMPAGDAVASDPARFWYVRAPDNVFQILKSKAATFEDAVNYIVTEKTKGHGSIPDAPFKTTWPELTLKRMIRYAAEHDYEMLAWTSGKVQAERYDLSKQVIQIHYKQERDGSYTIGLRDMDGNDLPDQHVPADKLADTVGKELADKIVKNEGRIIPGTFTRKFEGLDLKIGGEGMTSFYDRELVNTANKLVKKFDTKVEKRDLDLGERSFDVVDATDEGDGTIYSSHRTREDADLAAREHDGGVDVIERAGGREDIHTLPFTPELRKAATSQGFPLFQRGAEGEARGRITLMENKAIVALMGNADRSTFTHEMGHLWLDELVRDASGENVPQALKEDLGVVLRWLGVATADDIGVPQHEQWARGFEQYLREGRAPSSALAQAFETFKRWLMEIYKAVSELGTPITDDIRAVMDRMLTTESERALAEHPVHAAIADLPPRAHEDVMHAGLASLMQGHPVAAYEMLDIAAKVSPRIEEAMSKVRPAPDVPESEIVTTHVGPRRARGRAAADPQTWSLFEYLADLGGLNPDQSAVGLRGELPSILDGNPFIPGFGPLLRKPKLGMLGERRSGGMTLEEAFEAAKEGGYLHDPADAAGTPSNLGLNDLLNLIAEEARGNKQYKFGQEAPFDRAKYVDELEHHMDETFTEVGLKSSEIDPKLWKRTLQILEKEGESDPVVAYERAIMEDSERYERSARARRAEVTEIEGWDVPDEAGATPRGREAIARTGEPGPERPAGASAPGPDAGPGARPGRVDDGEPRGAQRPGAVSDRAAIVRDVERGWNDLAVRNDPANDPEVRAALVPPQGPASVIPDSEIALAPRSKARAESLKAAAEDEARSIEMLDLAVKDGSMTPEVRAKLDAAVTEVDAETQARSSVVRDGVGCLVAGLGLS